MKSSVFSSDSAKVIGIPLIIVVLAAIWWGVFSVVGTITEDKVRGVFIASAYLMGLLFFTRWIFFGISNENTEVTTFSIAMTVLYALVGAGILWLNGNVRMDTLKQADFKIAWTMQNVIWLPAVLTGFFAYLVTVFAKRNLPVELPRDIQILEWLAISLAIIGSAWGTIDAFYGMTSDIVGAFWVAGFTELALLFFILTSLRANDEYTFWGSLSLATGYFIIAMLFQLLDGAIRQNGLDENTSLQAFTRNLIWVMPIVTGLGMGSILVVDAIVGGSSWVASKPIKPPQKSYKPSQPKPQPQINRDNDEPAAPPMAVINQLVDKYGYNRAEVMGWNRERVMAAFRTERAKEAHASNNGNNP